MYTFEFKLDRFNQGDSIYYFWGVNVNLKRGIFGFKFRSILNILNF